MVKSDDRSRFGKINLRHEGKDCFSRTEQPNCHGLSVTITQATGAAGDAFKANQEKWKMANYVR